MSKERHVTRTECDSVDEVCALFNEVFQELRGIKLLVEDAIRGVSEGKAKTSKKGGAK